MPPHFQGLVAAPHTPFHDDFSLNLPVVEQLAACMIANRLAGVFVNGATGESMSLAVSERLALAARWCELCREKIPVIVHVGHTSLPEAQSMAAHAEKSGAFAIAAMSPPFFKPPTVEDLVHFCRLVAAAAPKLPFYYYHLPLLTGVNFPMTRFLEIAAPLIPTLAGIKYTHGDMMDFLQCLHHDSARFDIMFGQDEQLLAALACGGAAAVGSTYGHSAPLYHRLLAAFHAGDLPLAQKLQLQSTRLVSLLIKYGPMATSKALMQYIGINCGSPRPPLKSLSPGQIQNLHADLHNIGFGEFHSRV